MSKPLITIVGMGTGISYAVAQQFGRQGFSVAMIARNAERLNAFAKDLEAQGIAAMGFPADVTDFDALSSALRQVQQQAGNTEVLVYNVSAYRESQPSELNPDSLVHDFKANVAAALVAVQAVAGSMKQRGHGTIFLTGGGTALRSPSILASLAVGKAGLRSLARSLHEELSAHGILVTTVTVNGAVARGGRFDPDLIALRYWNIFQQREQDRQWEIMFE
jgi:short-subunit dehydrogenase